MDALWSGIPVLVWPARSMVSRAAAGKKFHSQFPLITLPHFSIPNHHSTPLFSPIAPYDLSPQSSILYPLSSRVAPHPVICMQASSSPPASLGPSHAPRTTMSTSRGASSRTHRASGEKLLVRFEPAPGRNNSVTRDYAHILFRASRKENNDRFIFLF